MVPPDLSLKKGTTMLLSSGSCFLETSKVLELQFSNYLEVVSDIGIEDTIVDNKEDNGVDKNVLIEGNSTKVVLQEVLIDDQQVKKLRGRPKNASVNMPVSSGILIPLQNADVESDYDDVQSDKGENNEDHWPEVVDCGEVIPPKIVKKKRGRKPKSRKKEPEELENKKKVEGVGKAEKRVEQKSEKRQPQKLSKKGSTQAMCSICKKYGHNLRGHYKFVKAGESSSSHYLEAISPAEEASNDGDYLNMYSPEMWNNNHQGLNLAYQSTITQAPISEQVIVVQTDVVAAQGVDEVAIKGIETTRLSHTSKRDRLFKRKVMKEYIVEVQKKKKKKIGNHSKV
ncbi:hypothetical protein H5410_048846 [Solanum commersonii]|uniref:Uncharacterized protein n=1 Tax=Solanum commersonii TaxID=4109 RepID=A0A9J5XM61_SOLCO|nr:hypothetical protein H5410_048846 [Solanum commersonii]